MVAVPARESWCHLNNEAMDNLIKADILGDGTVLIEGRKLVEREELAEALGSLLQRDPNFILVIAPMENAHYEAVGKVIYTSHRVGVPPENLRYMSEDGNVATFDELRAQNPVPPMER
jgi:biopolymer transport protein ExbD